MHYEWRYQERTVFLDDENALQTMQKTGDFEIIPYENEIDLEIVKLALERLNVDEIGLDSSDIKYLKFIIENYGGGPVGIDTISAGLSEERDSIEDTIEPYLIQQGFINKTPRGRVATQNAYKHLKIDYKAPSDVLL